MGVNNCYPTVAATVIPMGETMLCYVSNSSEEILYIWKPQIETSASMLHVYAAIYSITNSHGYFGMGE